MPGFVHLHLHTEYSLLDGVARIKPLVEKVAAQGMTACAITDHGVMSGAYQFWSACKDAGIKPIIGCEVYVAGRKRSDKETNIDNERYHLTLLAKTQNGYHNLVKMVSAAHLEGFYYKPRVDKELLQQYGKGIIALSGCLGSNFNQLLMADKRQEAVEWIKFLQSCFDEVYIELQRNGIKESDDLIPTQVEIAQQLKLKYVATCDSHYIEPQDFRTQEIAWCIADGTKLDDPNRRQYGSQEFYVKGPEQMQELFKDMPEAVAGTQELADGVEELNLSFERVQPQYDPKLDHHQVGQLLREQAFAGAQKRYGKLTKELKERLDYELKVIDDKGYNDYFMVVQDYVQWAKQNGILVGPGRGSGAGSVVAYSLGITNLDPIHYKLIFERFLNPERPSPPDFDIDFQDNRRDELFEYIKQRYGAERMSFIVTYGRLKTRAAIRDVARVMGLDLAVADKLSKMIIVEFGKPYTVKRMMELEDFRNIVQSAPEFQELMGYVQNLEDIARHTSIHASGILITPTAVTDYLPMQLESSGGDKVVTQFEFTEVEYMGLMKFDFLGLANLTIIGNAVAQIKQHRQLDLDIEQIPLDDEDTYKVFQRGDTTAVFQFESDGMKRYLRELRPTEFEDLIFMAAAYRPGPMEYIPDYIKRKYGKQAVTYVDNSLESILKTTYGFAIYQEQVMEIAMQYAGYSMGAADILRRAMGKKKVEIMAKEREVFVKKAMENKHDKKTAEAVFAYLEPFANYGFNRSHSAAYALIAYQTAYLKAHYPVEFLVGLIESDLDSSDKLHRDLAEAEHMSVQVLAPDINLSKYTFSIEGDKVIRFGLGGIKGGGAKVLQAVVAEREASGAFSSLDAVVHRVGIESLSKKDLEALIKVGAMDSFGERNALLAVMPGIYDRLSKQNKQSGSGQTDMFSLLVQEGDEAVAISATPLPAVNPAESIQKLQWEKDLLGVFLSAHPMAEHNWMYLTHKFTNLSEIAEMGEGAKVKLLCFINQVKVIRAKTDGKPMAFLNIADSTGSCEAVVFSSIYQKQQDQISETTPVLIEGKVSLRKEEPSIVVDSLTNATNIPKPTKITVDICNVADQDELHAIRECFSEEGALQVDIRYGTKQAPKLITRKMHLTSENIQKLRPYVV